MNKAYEKLMDCCKSVKEKIGEFEPKVAIVLGAGLNAFGERVEKTAVIDYKDIDGFGFYGSGACGKIYFRVCEICAGSRDAGKGTLL